MNKLLYLWYALFCILPCRASKDDERLSVIRYYGYYAKVVPQLYFFHQSAGLSKEASALQMLQKINDIDRKRHYGFYLLSKQGWAKAHLDPPHTAPVSAITYPVDFYTLASLKVYFQDEDKPGDNLVLHNDRRWYGPLRKAFYAYLEDGTEPIPERRPWLIIIAITTLFAWLLRPFTTSKEETPPVREEEKSPEGARASAPEAEAKETVPQPEGDTASA